MVAEWTGIPVSRLSSDDSEALRGLEDALHKRVVGQNEVRQGASLVLIASRRQMTCHSKGNLPLHQSPFSFLPCTPLAPFLFFSLPADLFTPPASPSPLPLPLVRPKLSGRDLTKCLARSFQSMKCFTLC